MSSISNCISKHYLPNAIIFLQSFLLLTSGQYRQKFHSLFSQLIPIQVANSFQQQQFQKIPQALILGISILIMILISVNGIYTKMLGISIYAAYICFMYNIVQYHTARDISIFGCQIIVIILALVWNMDYYIEKQRMEKLKEYNRVKQQRQRIELQKGENNKNVVVDSSSNSNTSSKGNDNMKKSSGKNKK